MHRSSWPVNWLEKPEPLSITITISSTSPPSPSPHHHLHNHHCHHCLFTTITITITITITSPSPHHHHHHLSFGGRGMYFKDLIEWEQSSILDFKMTFCTFITNSNFWMTKSQIVCWLWKGTYWKDLIEWEWNSMKDFLQWLLHLHHQFDYLNDKITNCVLIVEGGTYQKDLIDVSGVQFGWKSFTN